MSSLAAIEQDSGLTTLRNILQFRSNVQVRNWLNSDAVKPAFEEYVSAFLDDNPKAGEPDFCLIMQNAGSNALLTIRRWNDAVVNKTEFAQVDHAMRFIFTIVNRAEEAEDDGQGKHLNREVEMFEVVIWRAFDVLMYLQEDWAHSNHDEA